MFLPVLFAVVYADYAARPGPFTDGELTEQAGLIADDAEVIRGYFDELSDLPDPQETAWMSWINSR